MIPLDAVTDDEWLEIRKAGNRIKRLRHVKGMTQPDLAEKAGLSRNFLGTVERGRQVPSMLILLRIADGLGVDIARIVSDAAWGDTTFTDLGAGT